MMHSTQVVEQIIRPTGLLDPVTYIYPQVWRLSNTTRHYAQTYSQSTFCQKYANHRQALVVSHFVILDTKDSVLIFCYCIVIILIFGTLVEIYQYCYTFDV